MLGMDDDHTTFEEYQKQIENALQERDYNAAIVILEMLKEKQGKGLLK